LILPLNPAALISFSIFGSCDGSHIPSSAKRKLIGVNRSKESRNLLMSLSL
jgi:homoserine acetyltransferase